MTPNTCYVCARKHLEAHCETPEIRARARAQLVHRAGELAFECAGQGLCHACGKMRILVAQRDDLRRFD